jgi:hypothetical protein
MINGKKNKQIAIHSKWMMTGGMVFFDDVTIACLSVLPGGEQTVS